MHKAAVTDRREHRRKGNLVPQNRGPEVAIFHCNRLMRSEGDVLKGATIFAQRIFGVCTAIKIIEDRPGHASFRYTPKVGDVEHARRRKFGHCSRESENKKLPASKGACNCSVGFSNRGITVYGWDIHVVLLYTFLPAR